MSDNTKATIRRIVEAVWRGASAAFGPDLVSWDGLDLEAREQLLMQATGHLIDVGLAALVEENHRLREALGVKERMSPHTLNAPLPEVLEAHFPAAEWLLSTDPDTIPKDVWTREMTSVWLLLQRLRFEVEKVQPRPVPEGQPIEPDENLRQQIEAAKAIETLGEDPALYHAESVAQLGAPLAKLVLDLDAHLAAGGMPPKRWTGNASVARAVREKVDLDDVKAVLRRVLDSIAIDANDEICMPRPETVREVLNAEVGKECERVLGAAGKLCYDRWTEAGYEVVWDGQEHMPPHSALPVAYVVRPNGAARMGVPLARLETVAKVDRWIAEHPAEVPT